MCIYMDYSDNHTTQLFHTSRWKIPHLILCKEVFSTWTYTRYYSSVCICVMRRWAAVSTDVFKWRKLWWTCLSNPHIPPHLHCLLLWSGNVIITGNWNAPIYQPRIWAGQGLPTHPLKLVGHKQMWVVREYQLAAVAVTPSMGQKQQFGIMYPGSHYYSWAHRTLIDIKHQFSAIEDVVVHLDTFWISSI